MPVLLPFIMILAREAVGKHCVKLTIKITEDRLKKPFKLLAFLR